MSAISTYLQQIITAIWAKDVRQAIHDAISQCYDDVNAPALQTEAMQAAVQAKIDAGEMAALTIADGSLTGAKLADGTIPTAKIADGAITAGKLASGAVSTDTTLTQSGKPADAKAAGDAIAEARRSGGLSQDAKSALLSCFESVLWKDASGKELVRALREALQMSRRRSDLPNAYEQVEYIAGTGTQWVTLDINSQIPMSVEAEMLYANAESNVFTGDGSSSINSSTFRMLGFGKYDSASAQDIGVRFGTYGWHCVSGYSLNTLYTVRAGIYKNNGTNTAYVQVGEDARSEWALQGEIATGNPMRLYKRADDAWIGRGSQFHSLKVYGSGNQLIFDGIPCYRKTDNVGGLYDVVSSNFYPSDSTDNFVIGEVVER